MGSSITHVANATGKPIRVYYSTEKIRLEEVVQEVSRNTLSAKMVFKRDSIIRYIRIPAKDFFKISDEGAIYVSVFVENSACSDDWEKTICLNFYIPNNRSFIVTKNHNIKFQEYGGISGWTSKATDMANRFLAKNH